MEWNLKKWPISFTTSVIGNILYYALLIPGMIAYPNYSPLIYAVSSIGAVTRNPNGWFFFTICLVLLGIIFIPYYYGFNQWYEDEPDKKNHIRIVQILGFLDCISLILIGIHPTDINHPPHEFWSMMNFLFILSTIITLNAILWNHPGFDKRIAYFGFVVCSIGVFYGVTSALDIKMEIFEHLAFMKALIYALLVGIQMFKNKLE